MVGSSDSGLFLPMILIYIMIMGHKNSYEKKDIENALKVPIIGDIPLGDEEKKLIVELDSRSNVAEAFRLIRTNLDFILNPKTSDGGKVIGVTSTMAGEGKSFVSLILHVRLLCQAKKYS